MNRKHWEYLISHDRKTAILIPGVEILHIRIIYSQTVKGNILIVKANELFEELIKAPNIYGDNGFYHHSLDIYEHTIYTDWYIAFSQNNFKTIYPCLKKHYLRSA